MITKPKALLDRAGALPNYVTLSTTVADATVTADRVNNAIAAGPAATRFSLGLGSAALQPSSAFASALAGSAALSALQPGVLPVGTTLSSAEADSLVTGTRVRAGIAADVVAARTSLGLGSAALQPSSAFANSSQGTLAGTALQPGVLPVGTTLASGEADTLVSASRVRAGLSADAAAARTALGLGSAALQPSSAFANSSQGTLAGTALQPGILPAGTTLISSEADALVTATRVRAGLSADAAAARTSLGLGSAAVQPDSRYVRTVLGQAPDAAGNVTIQALTLETSTIGGAIRGFFSASYVQELMSKIDYTYRAKAWSPGEEVEVGAVRLPTAYFLPGAVPGTVKIHRAIQKGKTGVVEPTWATSDYYINSAASDTTDGTVVWRAYLIIHVDTNVADNSGDGSQGAPYRDWRATPFTSSATLADSAWSPGRCVALKRNSVFNSYQPTGFSGQQARMFVQKPPGATATYPERRTIMSYGQGVVPIIDGGASGVLRFGIRVNDTSSTNHEGFITIQDVAVTAIGGTLTSNGGAGIYVGSSYAERTPGYSQTPTNMTLLGVKVYDFSMVGGGTAVDGPDMNGIHIFGSGTNLANCEVYGSGDDNIWLIGSNITVVGCRTSRSATHSVTWTARQRGDELQVCSSPWNDNGDTVCNNITIVGNSLIHDNPNKHVLIVNPEVSGVDTRSKNYIIAYNYIESATTSTYNQIPMYLSGFEGKVFNNMIVSKHTMGTGAVASVLLNAAVDFYNNLIHVYGDYRGIEPGNITLNGGAVYNSSNGCRIFNNTCVNLGTAVVGILNLGPGNNVTITNNLIVGFTTGIQMVTGSKGGYNAFQGVTTNYAGSGTNLNGDVSGADLKIYMGVPYSKDTPLRGAGTLGADSLFNDFSNNRRIGSKPTIGCCEAPVF